MGKHTLNHLALSSLLSRTTATSSNSMDDYTAASLNNLWHEHRFVAHTRRESANALAKPH